MTARSFATTRTPRDTAGPDGLAAVRGLTPAAFSPAAATPRVWVLSSPRAGERSQLLALAEALGCPFEVKRIAHQRLGSLVGLVSGEHLIGVDRQRSDALDGPWPDLVLLAHQSNENVARWIRRQSGGKTRLVLIGRPWAPADVFDLVITTPQYDLPEAANVLHNPLPLHQVAPDRLTIAAAKWQPRLAHLPRPYVVVLVGGSSGPYVFDEAAAARLGREASALARSLGGSVLVTTSARTQPAAVDALFAAVDAPACLHRWAPGDSQNPYFGFMALADRVVVTADSISMIAEACATGKPVQMFDFGAGSLPMRDDADAVGRQLLAGQPCPWLAVCRVFPAAAWPPQPDARSAHRPSGAAGHGSGWLARRRSAVESHAAGRRRDDPHAQSPARPAAGAAGRPAAARTRRARSAGAGDRLGLAGAIRPDQAAPPRGLTEAVRGPYLPLARKSLETPLARQELRLEPVAGKAGLKAFIGLTRAIYADDPHWVQPLTFERLDHLNQAKNPFLRAIDVRYWIAYRGTEPVGRVSAQVNQRHLDRHGDATGHFGFLEAVDDPEVFAILMGAAEGWLRERGMARVAGPFSLSINDESGLLVEGFDTPPSMMMGHGRAYYRQRLEALGYGKAKDLIAYDVDATHPWPETTQKLIARVMAMPGVRIRTLDMRRYREEIGTTAASSTTPGPTPGLIPFGEDEAAYLAKTSGRW